jgi:hypothetical protein
MGEDVKVPPVLSMMFAALMYTRKSENGRYGNEVTALR